MAGTAKLFLVGSLSALMVCAAFALGIHVGTTSPPASPSAAASAAPTATNSAPPRASLTPPKQPRQPAPRPPPRTGPRPLVPPDANIEVPEKVHVVIGTLRAEVAWTVRRAPDESAETTGTVPAGTLAQVRALVGPFGLIGWTGPDGSVLFGWIVLPASATAPAAATGTLVGHVRLAGQPPHAKVPDKRKDADFCKDTEILDSPVAVNDGKLADVVVRLTAIEGIFDPPADPADIAQINCTYFPRVLAAMQGQSLRIRNGDGTLHNVHAYDGADSLFNQALVKQSQPIVKDLPPDGVLRLACDVHPWMRAHVLISPHPFFAVTAPDGTFRIEKIPTGQHTIEAWHPSFRPQQSTIQIDKDSESPLNFTFEAAEIQPENPRDKPKGTDLEW